MFTGIVQTKAKVIQVIEKEQFRTLRLQVIPGHLQLLQRGASVAINGTCLTATQFDIAKGWVEFDVIAETLKLTNLGLLQEGSAVNLERSLKFGDEIGGHIVSGHVQGVAEIIEIVRSADNCAMKLRLPKSLHPYIFSKGFIAVDGISLTVGEVSDGIFALYLIPETLTVTTLGERKVGDLLNIEMDQQSISIVQTVERVLAARGLS
jgi:riboflavin synthase